MKIVKRIALIFLGIIFLSMLGGYFYFDQKFTPEKNYLQLENESGEIPIVWERNEKNALLVPITFKNDTVVYYLQFDTGSAYTMFYTKQIKDISAIATQSNLAKASFFLGKTKISSDKFKLFDQQENYTSQDSIKVIGTLGADVLEGRKTNINFKDHTISFNLNEKPPVFSDPLFDFKFKKRKIIILGLLKEKKEEFLYDSGTSAYELLTNKEIWENLKDINVKIIVEKSKSWNNVLTTYTAGTSEKISFKNKEIPLMHVTHVQGFSKTQFLLMKFSGMTGMLGNKIFLNHNLYIDGKENKMGIK